VDCVDPEDRASKLLRDVGNDIQLNRRYPGRLVSSNIARFRYQRHVRCLEIRIYIYE